MPAFAGMTTQHKKNIFVMSQMKIRKFILKFDSGARAFERWVWFLAAAAFALLGLGIYFLYGVFYAGE